MPVACSEHVIALARKPLRHLSGVTWLNSVQCVYTVECHSTALLTGQLHKHKMNLRGWAEKSKGADSTLTEQAVLREAWEQQSTQSSSAGREELCRNAPFLHPQTGSAHADSENSTVC